MAQSQQEEGWPLGLQNARVGLGSNNNNHYSGSISFNTTLTGSPSSSTDFSSDLDTESTGSFFHDKSITLGSLIGVSRFLEFSRRSLRGRRLGSSKERIKSTNITSPKDNKSSKRFWLFSLCSEDRTDANIVDNNNNNNPPSLGHFLAVERRAATECSGRNPNPLASPTIFGPNELGLAQPDMESNSLFVNGCVAPPQSSPCAIQNESRRKNMEFENSNGCGLQNLFSCICAQPSH